MFNLGKFGATVELDTSQFDAGMKGIDSKTKRASGGLGGFAKSIGKIAGGLGVFTLVSKGVDMVKQSMDGAIDRYDTLNNFPRVMEQIGFDAESSQGAIDKLSDGIQGLPTRLDEVADTAQSIAIMTGDLDGAVDTTLALNNAFLASGATTADAERGLRQYTQMLSKGKVDQQSWYTLQETMPYALRETAEAFGFTGDSATNDFYEALKSGDITMDEFNSKLVELDTAQGGFADTAQQASAGIKTAWKNMQTWVVMGVTKIIEAIDEAFGGVGSIEGAINSLKPVFDFTFSFIADVITKTGEVVKSLKEKFDIFKESISPITEAMQPLLEIFQQTADNVISGLQPTFENLMNLFDSLKPILEILATLLGATLLTAIMIITSAWNGLYSAIIPLINAFINLVDVVVNVVNTIVALLMGDFDEALEYWNEATESAVEFFKNLWEAVIEFFVGIIESFIGWFEFLYEAITGDSINLVDEVLQIYSDFKEWLVELVSSLVESVVQFFVDLYTNSINTFNNLVSGLTGIWSNIKNTFAQGIAWIDNKTNGGFSKIVNIIKNLMNSALNVIKSVWNYIRNTFTNVLSFLKSLVTGDFTGMKNAMQSQMQNARNLVSNILGNLKSRFSSVVGGILSNVKGKFNSVRDAMFKPVQTARDKIKSAVDKIKGFFTGMNLKIPSIKRPKLPKFTMSGKFGVNPPSVPKFGISWFKTGGIMTKPTAFGRDGNNIMAGGEAGAEAILPLTSSVLGDIGKGISSTMQGGQSHEEVALLKEQNRLLRQIASKDNNTYLDGKKITNNVNDRQGTQYNMNNFMAGNR